MIGSAMAYGDGGFHVFSAAACLLGAILLQVGTNFCNDYADHAKGADTPSRVGPARAVASGWISPREMLSATVVVFLIASVICMYFVVRGGWPMLILGAASIISGIIYTAGPYPLAYIGLGDLFVLVFFGPVAVGGTYYVQTQHFSWLPVLAGAGPGLLSVAILTVNNLRDIQGDREAGKKTLAVRMGAKFARIEYALCLFGAGMMPLYLVKIAGASRINAAAAGLIIVAGLPVIRFVFKREGRELNPGLGMTAVLLLIYSAAFSIGWTMGGQ